MPNAKNLSRILAIGLFVALSTITIELAHADAPTSDMRDDWFALPITQGLRYQQFSSRDPGGSVTAGLDPGNKDFNNFLAICGARPTVRDQTTAGVACEDELSGYLIAKDDGPGVVSRIFFPASEGSPGFGAERIRIYVDGLDTPTYEAALVDWGGGISPPFVPPLTEWTSGALVSRVPITYRRSLRILLDNLRTDALYYYQIDVQHGTPTRTIPVSESNSQFVQLRDRIRAATDAETIQLSQPTIEPGAVVDILDETVAATLRQLNFSVREDARDTLNDLVLRVYWEGATEPALDLPLASLFGFQEDLVSYATLPLSVQVRGSAVELESSWPMPFFRRALITLTNTGSRARAVNVRAALSRGAPNPAAGHFHAATTERSAPFASGDRFPVVALRGHGKYVGTLMAMRGRLDIASAAPYTLGFLEGDERTVVDGETVGEGTGTEDYFDGGWYFRDGPFCSSFSAAIALSVDDSAGRGRATAVRWHVLSDAIEFSRAFELSFEYGADRPQSAETYRSVAFYYLSET